MLPYFNHEPAKFQIDNEVSGTGTKVRIFHNNIHYI